MHQVAEISFAVSYLSGLLQFFYLSFQVQLLHFLVTVSYPNKGARLWLLLSATIPLHLLFFFLPSTAHEIHTWRRTKEPENKQHIMELHSFPDKHTDAYPMLLHSHFALEFMQACPSFVLKILEKGKRKISSRYTATENLSSSIYVR